MKLLPTPFTAVFPQHISSMKRVACAGLNADVMPRKLHGNARGNVTPGVTHADTQAHRSIRRAETFDGDPSGFDVMVCPGGIWYGHRWFLAAPMLLLTGIVT